MLSSWLCAICVPANKAHVAIIARPRKPLRFALNVALFCILLSSGRLSLCPIDSHNFELMLAAPYYGHKNSSRRHDQLSCRRLRLAPAPTNPISRSTPHPQEPGIGARCNSESRQPAHSLPRMINSPWHGAGETHLVAESVCGGPIVRGRVKPRPLGQIK